MFMKMHVDDPVSRRYSKKDISPKIGSPSWALESSSKMVKPESARYSGFGLIGHRSPRRRSSFQIVGANIGSHKSPQNVNIEKRELQKRFADDLKRQILLKQKKQEALRLQRKQWDQRKQEEMSRFDPFGKPGCGAPILGDHGEIVSDYSKLWRQSLNQSPILSPRVSPHNYFCDELPRRSNQGYALSNRRHSHPRDHRSYITPIFPVFNDDDDTPIHHNDNFLGALNAMTNPKSPHQVQIEQQKKQRLKDVLEQQIEEKRRRKAEERERQRKLEMKEMYEYQEYLKKHPKEIPSPRAVVKKTKAFSSPPSFIPRARRLVNVPDVHEVSNYSNSNSPMKTIDLRQRSPSMPSMPSFPHCTSGSSRKKLFDDVLLNGSPMKKIHIPDLNPHRNYGSNTANIKNYRDNDYFFRDLLNKEWHPEDVHLKEMHIHQEEKRKDAILKASMYPSNSVFVFDDAVSDHKEMSKDRQELELLLRSFVDKG